MCRGEVNVCIMCVCVGEGVSVQGQVVNVCIICCVCVYEEKEIHNSDKLTAISTN